MANEVTIIVRAVDATRAGFDSARATGTSFAGAMGAIGMAATAALAGVAYEATKMAIDFQTATTKLVTQAGASQSQLKELQNGVLDLAAQVGFSPDSLAESLYHVVSNMQSMGATSQQELNVVKIAAEGAKVGGADLVDVTNALTAAVASGIPGVQDYAQAMGVLNATVGTGDMTMQNLAQAFGTGMVAAVKGYGLSIKDVGAALAVFGDNNIRGANAGTQLRVAVQALAVPAKAGAAELQKLGLSTTQLATDMQKGGLQPAIQDLVDHMNKAGITAQQQGQIITEIFGKKAGVGLSLLVGQVDRLNSKYTELGKGASQFGSAWDTTQQNVSTKLDRLKGGFDALMIELGDKLLPVASELIDALVKGIPAVEKLIKEMEPSIKKAIDAFKFGDNFKDIEKDFGKLVDAFKKNWPEIKQMMEAVGVVILTIVKGILILIDVVIKVDTFMVGVWSRAVDAVNKFNRAAQQVWSDIKKNWNEIVGVFRSGTDETESIFTSLGNEIAKPFIFINNIIQSFANLFIYIWKNELAPTLQSFYDDTLAPVFAGAQVIIKDIGDAFMWLYNSNIKPSFEAVGSVFTWLWNSILWPFFSATWKVLTQTGDSFKQIFGAIGGFIKAGFGDAVGFVRSVLDGIISVIDGAIDAINSVISGVNKIPGVSFPHIPKMPMFAAGGITAGGIAGIAERGMEIVSLPSGTHVASNADSGRMLTGAAGQGGQQTLTLNITGDGSWASSWLAQAIREANRLGHLQGLLTG